MLLTCASVTHAMNLLCCVWKQHSPLLPFHLPPYSLGKYRILGGIFSFPLMLLFNRTESCNKFQLFFSHPPSHWALCNKMPPRRLHSGLVLFRNTADVILSSGHTLDRIPAQHLMWEEARKNPSCPWLKISGARDKAEVMPTISLQQLTNWHSPTSQFHAFSFLSFCFPSTLFFWTCWGKPHKLN